MAVPTHPVTRQAYASVQLLKLSTRGAAAQSHDVHVWEIPLTLHELTCHAASLAMFAVDMLEERCDNDSGLSSFCSAVAALLAFDSFSATY